LTCANFTTDKVLQKMAVRDVFVAVRDRLIVGTVSFGRSRNQDRPKLLSLFVAPLHQGKRVGAGLVDHLERHAVAKGVTTLWVSSSIPARTFYGRLGYRQHEFEERDDGSTFLMSKEL
jgi:predicted N-acetyltransferase YhbS